MKKTKIGVMISGRGSNLQSLIEACKDPEYPAQIVLVISNIPDALGLKRAEEARIPTRTIPHKDFAAREDFESQVTKAMQAAGVELICLAGFMRLLSPSFIDNWLGKILNIHPSLLPKFVGLDTHRRAIDAGESEHGCTVHIVTADLDMGPILLQETVPVYMGDTPSVLADRVLEQEHKIYPKAVLEWIREHNN